MTVERLDLDLKALRAGDAGASRSRDTRAGDFSLRAAGLAPLFGGLDT